MLKVTIANFENVYSGTYDTHNEHVAVTMALKSLIKDHEFFDQNRYFPDICTDKMPGYVGFLYMPGEVSDPEETEYKRHHANTYEVYVEQPDPPNKMIQVS
jgi:hypothetical protein